MIDEVTTVEPMPSEKARAHLQQVNPDALLADGLNGGIVGIAKRETGQIVAAYSYDLCVELLASRGMGYDNAIDWMDYNVVGSWLGPHTPVFVLNCEAQA